MPVADEVFSRVFIRVSTPIAMLPFVLPIVQSILNNSLLLRMEDRCDLTVLTGLVQDFPLININRKSKKHFRISSITEVRARQVMKVEELTKALESFHMSVAFSASSTRKRSIVAHNRNTNLRPVNFSEGDLVLRGIYEREWHAASTPTCHISPLEAGIDATNQHAPNTMGQCYREYQVWR